MSDPADTNAEKKRGRPFEPGQVANPLGRPKGSRNKLGEAFIQALADDFDQHGVKAIETVRTEKPDAYVKVIASLLPKEFKIETVSELTDEQLNARIAQLADVFNRLEGGVGFAVGGSQTAPGSKAAH
jgi:hypothetical protein